MLLRLLSINVYSSFSDGHNSTSHYDGMDESVASWTDDLKVGNVIPAMAQGYLIFPAQKDERHTEQLHSPGVER